MHENENYYLIKAAKLNFERQQLRKELSIVNQLGLKPIRDGNQWGFLWGEDLQSGIAGFGDSISDAVKDFNKSYFSDDSNK